MSSIPRIFVEKNNINQSQIVITGTDVFYLSNVLRLKKKDKIIVLDGTNKEYLVEIAIIKDDKIICQKISENNVNDISGISITLVQSLPKHKKMDLIIEKATELGVSKIIPVITERTIVKGSGNKLTRWKRIAKESSEQCGRCKIPIIEEITDFDNVFREIRNYELSIMPWELEKENSIKKVLKENFGKEKIVLFIGNEGGFSLTEVKKAIDNGVKTVSLGNLILRVETAVVSTLSIINYEYRTRIKLPELHSAGYFVPSTLLFE